MVMEHKIAHHYNILNKFVLGYIKCNFGANKDISSATNDFVRGQVFKNAVGFLAKSNQPTVVNNSRATGIV